MANHRIYEHPVRTSIILEERMFKALKIQAVVDGISLSQLIANLVDAHLTEVGAAS